MRWDFGSSGGNFRRGKVSEQRLTLSRPPWISLDLRYAIAVAPGTAKSCQRQYCGQEIAPLSRLPARTALARDCCRVGLCRAWRLPHHCTDPRRSGDRCVRLSRCPKAECRAPSHLVSPHLFCRLAPKLQPTAGSPHRSHSLTRSLPLRKDAQHPTWYASRK
jgi:hypothetical protein